MHCSVRIHKDNNNIEYDSELIEIFIYNGERRTRRHNTHTQAYNDNNNNDRLKKKSGNKQIKSVRDLSRTL